MAALLRKLASGYQFVIYDLADPRTSHLFLIPSPFPGLALLAVYVYVSKFLGPRLMKDRKPMRLDKLIQFYNIVQIAANVYILFMCLKLGWLDKYRWVCEPVDFSDSPSALEIAYACYHFFLIKLLDLLDTIFFVLRKKNSQVTFLHVYHHTGMVMLTWGCVKYFPGGHGTFLGLVNSIIHIIMYTYYLITSISSDSKRYIWWKKYLTQLQMVQFLLLVIHFGNLLFVEDCEFPVWVAGVLVPQNVFMLALFYDFYSKTYRKKTK